MGLAKFDTARCGACGGRMALVPRKCVECGWPTTPESRPIIRATDVGGQPGAILRTRPLLGGREGQEATIREVWREVIARRREWHHAHKLGMTLDDIEQWSAADTRWPDFLLAMASIVESSRAGRVDRDPREAVIDVMAVCSALLDAMDGRPGA